MDAGIVYLDKAIQFTGAEQVESSVPSVDMEYVPTVEHTQCVSLTISVYSLLFKRDTQIHVDTFQSNVCTFSQLVQHRMAGHVMSGMHSEHCFTQYLYSY